MPMEGTFKKNKISSSSVTLGLLFVLLLFVIQHCHGIKCYECVFLAGVTNDSCVHVTKKNNSDIKIDCSNYTMVQTEKDEYGMEQSVTVNYNYCEVATAKLDGKRAFHRACSSGPINENASAEYVDDGFATDGSKIAHLHVEYCNDMDYCNDGTVSAKGSNHGPLFKGIVFVMVIAIVSH